VAPGGLLDLVDRTARNVAGIVDEDVDVGGLLYQARDVVRLAQVDDMGRGIDLVGRSQPLGNGLELIAAAGRKAEMAAFLAKASAAAAPMPFEAPVIRTRLPRK